MFKTIVNPYNPVMQFINKLVYSVWLNILWFICCIPVVTIGPSTAALFYCCQRMVEDTDSHITKAFFKSFGSNLKQGAVIGLIMTFLGCALWVDGYTLSRLYANSLFWTIVTAIFIVACILYVMISMYIYPLLAHFENTTFAMFKNAFLLSIRYLLCTILMALIYFAMLLVIVRFYTPAIVFGMGTSAFFCSLFMQRILKLMEPEA